MFKRMVTGCMNILFPPLAVYMLCGVGEDLLINSILFLLAVIPSHVHGFYLSWTYFNRKRKVRKGRYPGSRRPMIYCSKVQNGGATSKEVRQMKRTLDEEKALKKQNRQPGRVRRLMRRALRRHHRAEAGMTDSFYEKEDIFDPEYSNSSPISYAEDRESPRSSRRLSAREQPIRLIEAPTVAQQNQLVRRNTIQASRRSRPPSALEGQLQRTSLYRTSSTPQEVVSGSDQRPPPLPRRTYRSDIDGWLVGVRPGELPA